jgi:iron complex transport system permease protein
VALLLSLLVYLFVGRYPGPGFTNPALLFSDETARRIFFSLRLPRALGAILLGAVLGGAGAAFQSIFGNPLVDAGFLGVSQGAAFGAAAAIVVGSAGAVSKVSMDAGMPWFVAIASFCMAILALWLSIWLSHRFKFGGQVLRLVLAGLAVSALFSSLLSIVKYTADPLSQLPDIVFWTMGSLTAMGWGRLAGAAPIAIISLVVLFLMRWRATVLSLDDDVTQSMGMRPQLERAIVATAAAAGVAAMTAACGIVAWVGLVVPQIARILTGPDGRESFPMSMAGGAVFVLVADGFSRTILPGELPLGIVTAFFGALSFCLVLLSRKTEMAR